MTRLLTDADVEPRQHISLAIKAVEQVLLERVRGTTALRRRSRLTAGGNSLAFTPGLLGELGVGGLRVYPVGGSEPDQLVAVWELASGRLETLFIGSSLGVLRTGAIGGVALKTLALDPGRPIRIAMIGAGPQAFMQLVAASAVRAIDFVNLHRRDLGVLKATCERWSKDLGLEVRPAPSPQEAVAGADAVILATGATQPLLRADWIEPGAYVASLGPKRRDRAEVPLAFLEQAERIVSDFPEQHADDPGDLAHGHQVEDLAVAYSSSRPPSAGLTLFLSHGLAGTEVAVASLLARHLE